MNTDGTKKSTRDQIFESAVELFSKKGFHGTSMRELAREVGIKESSLYNHFSGKKAILEAIMNYQMAAFQGGTSALDELKKVSPDITDPVEFWMAGVMAFAKTQPPLTEPISRIIINEMFLNKQCREFVLNSLFKAQKDLSEMIFRVMFEKGMIRECDFHKMAIQYVYMIQGLEIENKLMMMEGQSQDDSFKNLIEHMTLFIEGLR